MDHPIRFAITGCGYIGAELARVVAAHPGAELVAAHSGSGVGARRVADELGCEVSDTLEELVVRDDVDALIVATPNHLHREPVVQAARNGKHVFCEKPFALSVSDGEAMVAACDASGVRLMLGHTMRFFSGIRRVKQWISDGVIGRPLVAHAERTGWEEPREAVSWKKQQASSGGHLFHHIHEIDLMLWLIGDVAAVSAVGDNLAHRGTGHGDEDDVVLLTLEFAGGGFATMQYGSGFRWGEHFVKVNGTEGAVRADFQAGTVQLKRGSAEPETFPLFDDPESQESLLSLFRSTDGGSAYGGPTDRPGAYVRRALEEEMADFIAVLRGAPVPEERRMLFDGSAGLASVRVAEAALRSMRARERVDVDG
ncbi:Gfo/Idh/MocA family oxidoreductase [Tessaracoccus terricola]